MLVQKDFLCTVIMAQAESLESRYIRVLEEHLNLLKISGSNAHNPQEALQAPISGVVSLGSIFVRLLTDTDFVKDAD